MMIRHAFPHPDLPNRLVIFKEHPYCEHWYAEGFNCDCCCADCLTEYPRTLDDRRAWLLANPTAVIE